MAPNGKGKASTNSNNASNNNNGNESKNSKAGGHSNPIATQSDDIKYKTKYKELKLKLSEVETDNNQLNIKILKSKKAIQRLRLERSILYDRLQTTTIPTNPFSLQTNQHLNSLSSSSSSTIASTSNLPPNIQQIPTNYTVANPQGPSLYLENLQSRKSSINDLIENGKLKGNEWGERPDVGIKLENQVLVSGSSSEVPMNTNCEEKEVRLGDVSILENGNGVMNESLVGLTPSIVGEPMQVDS